MKNERNFIVEILPVADPRDAFAAIWWSAGAQIKVSGQPTAARRVGGVFRCQGSPSCRLTFGKVFHRLHARHQFEKRHRFVELRRTALDRRINLNPNRAADPYDGQQNPNAKEATTPSNGFATHRRRHRAP
jgi:hypothetical protein